MVELPGAAAAVTAGFAVPLILMVCGEPGASSESVRVAAWAPTETGVNIKAIVQVPAAGMAAAQVGSEKLNSLALAPPKTALEMCRAAVPEFVTVTFSGVLVPCVAAPKSGLLGFTSTPDAGAAVAFP